MVLNELMGVLAMLHRQGFGTLPVEVYGLDGHPKPLVGIGSNGAIVFLGATIANPSINAVPPPLDIDQIMQLASE